jgi:hypothetical protein
MFLPAFSRLQSLKRSKMSSPAKLVRIHMSDQMVAEGQSAEHVRMDAD